MLRWIALIAAIVCIVAFAGTIILRSSSPPVQQEQAAEHSNEHGSKEDNKNLWDSWFPDSLSLFTLALVIFTAVLAFGGLYQLKFLERAERISARAADAAKDSADAAKKAAEVSERALVAVERPILLVEITNRFTPEAGKRPRFEFRITNIGKQVALMRAAFAKFVVAKDAPPALQPYSNDGFHCSIRTSDGLYMIGEISIKPTDTITVFCDRQRPIADAEIKNIEVRNGFGYLSVVLTYGDSVGFSRHDNSVFLLRPNGEFVRAFGQTVADTKTPEQDAENQRALIDTMLDIETNNIRKGVPQVVPK